MLEESFSDDFNSVNEMKSEYDMRRRYCVSRLNKMGLTCFEPKGAFYVFPCIKEFGMTSEEFATKFLEEEKVAAVPGSAFGMSGEGFLRISYRLYTHLIYRNFFRVYTKLQISQS